MNRARVWLVLAALLWANVGWSQTPGQTGVPLEAMAADADPSFEVATIKPSDANSQAMRGVGGKGRAFSAHNVSVIDMLVYAYGVQIKQITGGPAWAEKDTFDIAGVPDVEGKPTPAQMKAMCQKLMADRFQLKLHHESRELPAYVLSVAKGGPKLGKNASGQPGPGRVQMVVAKPGMLTFAAKNATMMEFSMALQQAVLDRPVLNRTELEGRYDFTISFAPTGTEFGGRMNLPPSDDTPAESLFAAVQRFGLKLEAEKTQVDVIVIDHVEKPSEN
jgi:uncharacterized protein (TIGR03435 family)